MFALILGCRRQVRVQAQARKMSARKTKQSVKKPQNPGAASRNEGEGEWRSSEPRPRWAMRRYRPFRRTVAGVHWPEPAALRQCRLSRFGECVRRGATGCVRQTRIGARNALRSSPCVPARDYEWCGPRPLASSPRSWWTSLGEVWLPVPKGRREVLMVLRWCAACSCFKYAEGV